MREDGTERVWGDNRDEALPERRCTPFWFKVGARQVRVCAHAPRRARAHTRPHARTHTHAAHTHTHARTQVIKGWDDAMLTMSKGERAILTIKPEFAWAEHGLSHSVPPDTVVYLGA